MKLISILLALLNSLVAGLILTLSLSGTEVREAAALWVMTKVLGAILVILVGALTWLDGVRPNRPSLVLAGSLSMVALGAAVVVWTIHLALVTGDMEAYMVLYGGSLIVQGGASVMGALLEPNHPIPT